MARECKPEISLQSAAPSLSTAYRLTRHELQWMHGIASSGAAVVDTYELFMKRRKKARTAIPDLTTIRRALEQYLRRCAAVETRGRKRKFSNRAVLGMEKIRKKLCG